MRGAAPVWTPDARRIHAARLTAFTARAEAVAGRPFARYEDLHRWSVTDRAAFWSLAWDATGVVGDRGGRVLEAPDAMPGARFFPDAKLNVAENLLAGDGDGLALVAVTEDGRQADWSWSALRAAVARAAAALVADGVGAGDRVAGMVANGPEAVVAALAAASIGAIWSSCSPDFGADGVVDRFGQIAPRVLIATAEYVYGGKRFDTCAKVAEIAARLPTLARVVFAGGVAGACGAVPVSEWDAWLAAAPARPLTFARLPFSHPLYILYSSGTTGVPKCIVHGAGGTLLQHLKEHQLHCDVRADDRVFYFTTCGWMMWHWLVSALASRATIVLYDGSPFYPDGRRLFDVADDCGVTLFGTSAKFIDAVRKAGLRPRDTHRLSTVRTITSTGSPLAPESFDFVYDAIAPDVHLASISGGTDIVSCFVLGVPTLPVHRGEIQAPGLGMRVEVFDDLGQAQPVGAPGELVCTAPFPSMPIGFWQDPDGARYRAAYFERFPGVWCHGDWVTATTHGGFVIAGRSDATLNPGGVRIGTAEIYRQVERLPEVLESLAVGQQWDGDERIVLFVRLREGVALDDGLRQRIASEIRTHTSPRHVPARIIAVADIPRTKSGKIVELAVRHVIHGRPVKNLEALANPEALDLFRGVPDLDR